MADNSKLIEQVQAVLKDKIETFTLYKDQLTIQVVADDILEVCFELRDSSDLHFEMLIDLCGIDYSDYGLDQWKTTSATLSGFSRGVTQRMISVPVTLKPRSRFAVAYHLLSLKHNQRIRVKAFLESEDPPFIDSVIEVWNCANWYEREAYDLYGILFRNHPDLRRILTDYGFTGHPFRKDFPVIGTVEMRYDAARERCIYDPVSINPRTLVPKVIREDHRYLITEEEGISHG